MARAVSRGYGRTRPEEVASCWTPRRGPVRSGEIASCSTLTRAGPEAARGLGSVAPGLHVRLTSATPTPTEQAMAGRQRACGACRYLWRRLRALRAYLVVARLRFVSERRTCITGHSSTPAAWGAGSFSQQFDTSPLQHGAPLFRSSLSRGEQTQPWEDAKGPKLNKPAPFL